MRDTVRRWLLRAATTLAVGQVAAAVVIRSAAPDPLPPRTFILGVALLVGGFVAAILGGPVLRAVPRTRPSGRRPSPRPRHTDAEAPR